MSKHTCPHIDRPIFSKGRCKACASKEYAQKSATKKKAINSINKFSDKRKTLSLIYQEIRKKYLEEHKLCKAGLNGCTIQATEIHHKYMRENLWLVCSEYYLPICRNCHKIITENTQLAFENNLSISSFGKIRRFFSDFELELLGKYKIRH
jgi:hypothetical protein